MAKPIFWIKISGGWGGGNLRIILVRMCDKTYPIHIPGLWKNGPIHILDHPKCWPIHILPFDFLYPFFAGYYTNITVNSCNIKRISSLEKYLSEKYVHIPGCQKNGAFHKGIQKNRAIHILFVEKRGPIIYLAALKKGAIRHTHPYYAIYRKLPPLPPPQGKNTLGDNLHEMSKPTLWEKYKTNIFKCVFWNYRYYQACCVLSKVTQTNLYFLWSPRLCIWHSIHSRRVKFNSQTSQTKDITSISFQEKKAWSTLCT